MAIVGTIYAGTQSKWGIAEQPTFGTAIADDAAFEQLEGPIPSVSYGVTKDGLTPKFDGARIPNDTNIYFTQTGGIRTISFSDLLVRRADLGNLIYGVLQQNFDAEGASTPFTKAWKMLNTNTQGDFAAAYNASTNKRIMFTVGIYDTIASYMRKFHDCVLRTLTLSADLVGGDGRLRAAGEFISGAAAATTANFSGTWALNAQNYYNFQAMSTKQVGATDVVVYGFSVTFTNNAVRVGGNTTGYAETYALPSYAITGSVDVKYDTAVQGLIADSLAGTGRAVQLAVGTAAAAGHFDMTFNECYFDDIGKDYGVAEGQKLTLPFTAVCDATPSPDTMGTVTISDAVDQSW